MALLYYISAGQSIFDFRLQPAGRKAVPSLWTKVRGEQQPPGFIFLKFLARPQEFLRKISLSDEKIPPPFSIPWL